MDIEKPLYFVFLWLPNKANNTAASNELLMFIQMYESAIALIRKDSKALTDFHLVMTMEQLLDRLQLRTEEYHTVFILLGHGDPNTGAMCLWNGEYLRSMNDLLQQWKPHFRCDLVATQCGSNAFCNVLLNPAMLYYNRYVRFLAAAEPNTMANTATRASEGPQLHRQLTKFLILYLRVHDDGGQQKVVKQMLARLENQPPLDPVWRVPSPSRETTTVTSSTKKGSPFCTALLFFLFWFCTLSPDYGLIYGVIYTCMLIKLYRNWIGH